jgi:hypothetical protein
MHILKTTSTLVLCCATALAGFSASASAQNAGPSIAVPSEPAPSTAGIDGCWKTDHQLYGRYRLSFCPSRHGRGEYTITGGGLHCSAGLTWFRLGGTYQFAMQRAHCGNHTDWTADLFNCSLTSDRDGEPGRIAVPSGDYGELRCNYAPAVWGYPWTKFSAYRT